jgi:hypothetical protein
LWNDDGGLGNDEDDHQRNEDEDDDGAFHAATPVEDRA